MTDSTKTALEMSDEEFANLDFDSLPVEDENQEEDDSVVVSEESSAEDVDANTSEDSTDSADGVDTKDTEATTEDLDDTEQEAGEEDEEDSEESSTDPDLTENDSSSKSKDSKETDTEESQEKTETTVNYEEAYKKLLAPFRANGKDIQVKNVEDAIQLMQMGANYNKKMNGLKPNLKLLKMLDNNGLLTEEKLTYLIDLDKKNPDAIDKLVKDSGLDPLDIDVKKPNEYKPNTYTVDDGSVELDQILDDIKDTASFNQTLDIIGNKWDITSRGILRQNPNIIKIINEHVESGNYQQIQNVVDTERMFGRLSGLSDLEAYKQVGDEINAEGGFSKTDNSADSTSHKIPVKAKAKAADPKLKSRKKAASSTNKSTGTTSKAEFNPLSMSDDEFEKMSASDFI